MKKLVLIAAIAIVSVSCKKDYNCNCYMADPDSDYGPMIINESRSSTVKAISKKKAIEKCVGTYNLFNCKIEG